MFTAVRIYNDSNGDSYFEGIDIPLQDAGSIGFLSEPLPAKSIIFREAPPDYDWDFHTAPQRQYIVLLEGEIENVFTKDELLANVTLYWITQTIHSSIRIYNENSRLPLIFEEGDFVKIPVGFARFPKELPTPPRSYIEKGFNIQHWTEMPAGGHFAAMEQPGLLAKDITKFFKALA